MNGKKINLGFSKVTNFFKNFGKLPKDEQYSYVAIGVGVVFIILGLVL